MFLNTLFQNVPPPGMAAGFSGQPSRHHSTSSHGHEMDHHGQSMEHSGGGRPLSPRGKYFFKQSSLFHVVLT